MKNKLHILVTMTLLIAACAHAQTSDRIGNGGDICENRFQSIRTDLASWIERGGAEDLKLPAPLAVKDYKTGMLTAISAAKISCTDQSIFIGKAEKTCKNNLDSQNTPFIQCNRERFMKTSEEDQYVLAHHEFAGIAGFEVNKEEASDYRISNQITAYLQNQVVKKLVVLSKKGWVQSGRAKAFTGPQGEAVTIIPLNGNKKLLLYATNTYGLANEKVYVYDLYGSEAMPGAAYSVPKDDGKRGSYLVLFPVNGEMEYHDMYQAHPSQKFYTITLKYSQELSQRIDVRGLLARAVEYQFPQN